MPSKRSRKSQILADLIIVVFLTTLAGVVTALLTDSRKVFNVVTLIVGGLLLLAFAWHHVRDSGKDEPSHWLEGIRLPEIRSKRVMFPRLTLAGAIILVVLLAFVGSGSSSLRSWPGGASGGWNCDPPWPMPQDKINPPNGTRTCDVWHTGYAPAGGYQAYRFHLILTVSWQGLDTAKPRFTVVHARVHLDKDRATIKWLGLIREESITKYYSCWINWFGQRTYVKNGCLYVYRKAQIEHMPVGFVKLVTARPSVALNMNALGELVRTPYWNGSVI